MGNSKGIEGKDGRAGEGGGENDNPEGKKR